MASWIIYVRIAAANRAVEALVAAWAILWGALVLLYRVTDGAGPGAARADDARFAVALVLAGAVHMVATNITVAHWAPATARALAMTALATTFGHLAWAAGSVSAAMSCAGYAIAALGGVRSAALDARYWPQVPHG